MIAFVGLATELLGLRFGMRKGDFVNTLPLKTFVLVGLACLAIAGCGPQRKIVRVSVPPDSATTQAQAPTTTKAAPVALATAKPGPAYAVGPRMASTGSSPVMRRLSSAKQPIWNSARATPAPTVAIRSRSTRPYALSHVPPRTTAPTVKVVNYGSMTGQAGTGQAGTRQLASTSPTQVTAAPATRPAIPTGATPKEAAAMTADPAQSRIPADWHKHLGSIDKGGIVISIGDRRLLYWGPGGRDFKNFPVAVARTPELTRMGHTFVARKKVGPDWRPTPSMLKRNPKLPAYVPPGPANPLGEYALYLDWRYYAIHGTNNPNSIGTRATSGCFRLYPKDIAYLFPRVNTGTPVVVVPKL
jgi:L,D-transpeptidase ErfK/SrfK